MNDLNYTFERAKVIAYFDDLNKELVFISRNTEEPLTDIEKKEIKNICLGIGIRACRFEEEKEK